MKNFKSYKEFIDDIIKLTLDLDTDNDFIITFSCLEPALKDRRLTYKRFTYVEVCGLNNTSNELVWFNDWYEGSQTSFDIESIIDITDVSKMEVELSSYKKLVNKMSYLSREAYEAIGLLEDEFRKEASI